MEYDVVILGGGPAGLKCAEVLGASKFKVLLVDKKEILGPKVCAGGLTKLYDNFNLPPEKTLTFKEQHIFLNGKKYLITLNNPIHTIDRIDLGEYQVKQVSRYQNIEIQTGVFVKEVYKDHILTGNNEKIYFKYLVGADGSGSLVRKYLGLKNEIYMGIQYIIPKTYNELIWFLNPKLIKSGYGWIFPHKEFTSAGVYYNPKLLHSDKAREALHEFLRERGIDYSDAKFEGAPINCSFKGLKFKNIFLIGDAAGLASRTTGEGIAYALASGEDVAKHLLDNNYSFERINRIIRYKKRQEIILSIFDSLPLLQSFLFYVFIKLMKRHAFQRYFE